MVLSQSNSKYFMSEASFRQFVCSYLEGELNRARAVEKIEFQIASIITEEQEKMLDTIRDSSRQANKFCSEVE